MRTVPDVRAIREWIEGHADLPSGMDAYTGYQTVLPARRAVVVGGGFIGLEMAENLVHLGLQVTLLQRGDHVLGPMDAEMACYVERHMAKNGVRIELNADANEIRQAAHGSLEVLTQAGQVFPADLVVLGIGVRPENWLAKSAGLEIGALGGIRVDDQMRTSDPDIFAVGDAVEVKDTGTGQWSLLALAGPANRQGRIAADVIAGRELAVPRRAGHCDHRSVRRRGRLDRRQRENAQPDRRDGLRKDLSLPELARGLLSGRAVPGDEDHLP